MKVSPRSFFGVSIALIFVIWSINVIVMQWGNLPDVQWSLGATLLVALLALVITALNSVIVETSAGVVGRQLGLFKSQAVGYLVTLTNYVLPLRGGLIIRLTAYVKFAEQDPFVLSSALTAAAVLIQFISVMVLLFSLSLSATTPEWSVAIAVMAVLTLLAAGLAWPLARRTRLGGRPFVRRILEGASMLLSSGPKVTLQISGMALLVLILAAFRYLVVGSIFALPDAISFTGALAIASAAGISSLFSVTAGGIGVREGIVIATASLIGISPAAGLVIALLDRFLVTLALVPVGVVSGLWWKRLVSVNTLDG